MADKIKLEFEVEGTDASVRKFERVEKELEELRQQVKRLGKQPLDIPTDEAQRSLKKLESELRRADKALERAERAVEDTRKEMKLGSKDARDLATAQKRLATAGVRLANVIGKLPPPLRKTARGLDEVEKQAEQAARAFRELRATAKPSEFQKLIGVFKGLRASVAGFIAGLVITKVIEFSRAIFRMTAEAVEVKGKFDSLLPTLKAFVGSTELAEEVIGQLSRVSAELKTPLTGLIQPFLGITAATKETNLSLEEQAELFRAALLTTRAFGLSTEETGRLLKGFAQVAGKGTLSMEELKQQIGEVAFNALPALAKALGTSVPQLIADVTNGAIDAETALRGFSKGLTEANEAAGLANLDTLKGDLGELARVAELAQKQFADGLEPGLRDATQTIAAFIVENEALITSLGEIGSGALQRFTAAVEDLSAKFDRLKGVADEINAIGAAFGFARLSANEAAKAGGEAKPMPIIALTAHAMASDKQACFEAGMNGYMTKPFRMERLVESLEKLFAEAE